MNDLFEDIDVIQSAIIAMQEGASDERRMALSNLRGLMVRKQAIITKFEAEEVEID
jgi:hypothetical protein|tara:strand:+ start:794 stop:961 length:168 start_codon:yes stop_codon:yes gene_type:complete